jgi:outer membrane immunogenic protein
MKIRMEVAAALGLSTLIAISASAQTPAQSASAYDWSGFYVGLNGGLAASHECLTITSVVGVPVTPHSEGCHDATGGLLGGQLGYRWQFSPWVFGLEAQGDWADLTGSNGSRTAIIPYINQTSIEATGLVTGQVGYAWANLLGYLKGGIAVTDNDYRSFFTATKVVFNETSETRWGGAVGTGIEYGFAPNWSIGVEYDHLFMGTDSVTFPMSAIAVTRSDNIRQGVDMGTVRLNYRFGAPIFARD